ncbi:MAG: sensor histidine kinase [Acidaminococcaceae bacterium]
MDNILINRALMNILKMILEVKGDIMAKSLLSKEQINLLDACLAGANLAADIAHAHVYIYVRDEDPKYINVYGQALPLKEFVMHSANLAGRKLRLAEEPLVGRALQSGMVVTGKRESILGFFAKIKLFPLLDNKRRCFAVVAFEKNGANGEEDDDIFIDMAMTMMQNFEQRFAFETNYRRLSPRDGILIVDKDKIIVAASNTARHILSLLGVPKAVGLRTNSQQINWPLVGMVIKAGMAESKEVKKQGLLLSIRVLPLTPNQDTKAAIVVLSDITELKKKEEELLVKSAVIKEIHHRVKNNLQTIASLLRMQTRRTEDESTKNILRDIIGRINSIALVHEALSQQDSDVVNVAEVAERIYQAIITSMVMPDFKLESSFHADELVLPSEQVTAIGLILNELLQNALEHGFENCSSGKITITLKVEGDLYLLEIADDGVGLPAGFSIGQTNSLGLKIIQTMAEVDLHGTFELLPLEKGTLARVEVPIRKE